MNRRSSQTVYLVANGDLRLSANQKCWPAQEKMEAALIAFLKSEGASVLRAHAFDKKKAHGFIDSQKMGLEVFRHIPKEAPLIIAESVWQYSHHLLGGLWTHRGPILTVANWSGTWPGLVGMNLINVGKAQILSIPGEALPNIGFYLKRKMHGAPNFLFGLTNDAFGYILTKVDFNSFKRYEYVSRTSLGEMTGETLIEEALKLIESSPNP